jgi:hypothetical protein
MELQRANLLSLWHWILTNPVLRLHFNYLKEVRKAGRSQHFHGKVFTVRLTNLWYGMNLFPVYIDIPSPLYTAVPPQP